MTNWATNFGRQLRSYLGTAEVRFENCTFTDQVALDAATAAERARITAILRAVSPNAGQDCKTLIEELIMEIEK